MLSFTIKTLYFFTLVQNRICITMITISSKGWWIIFYTYILTWLTWKKHGLIIKEAYIALVQCVFIMNNIIYSYVYFIKINKDFTAKSLDSFKSMCLKKV